MGRADTAGGGSGGDTSRMKPCCHLPLFCALLLTLPACERRTVVVEVPAPTPIPEPVAKTKTLETSRLGTAVDAYLQDRTAERSAEVKKALADLDVEIAELETLVAKRTGGDRGEAALKLRNLQTYRAAETARLSVGQIAPPNSFPASSDARSGAEKVEDAAKRTGKTIENTARKTGDAIKDAVR